MVPRRPQGRPARSPQPAALRRSVILGAFLAFWIVGLVARLYHLQIYQYVDLLARAQRQQQRTVEIAPKRGAILDREMRPLAMSLAVDSIFAVPSEIPDREMVAKLVAPVLGLEAGDLLGRFKAFKTFCWVKRKASGEEASRIRDLNLKGIYFQKEMKRFYPKGELAAQTLGYVGMDDTGLAGLEFSMDGIIRGRPGRMLVAADARRQSFRSSEWQGQPGKNVVLTLDENIQYIAEKALGEAVARWKATGGAVVVQNPHTGEILALASEPAFNPNEYAKSRPESWLNRGVSWVYEPGSTFKLVTLSAALEENLTYPREIINCQQGSIVLAGHTIHDHRPFGDLTVEQVLAESSDVGAIKLGLRLGSERVYRYIRSFGFGSSSEVKLPGEERGLLKPPSRWSGISIGEISMGQEIGVTPVQLATAYSAIANGGILFQPRTVRDIFRGDFHEPPPPVTGRRVVSERTSETMRRLLAGVVEHGTGRPAQLVGYSAAGKTGTAQKIDDSGTYSKSHYVASFVGFAPAEKPAVTILVAIDSPVGEHHGTEVAAPVFRSIAEQTLGYLNVPQDNPSRWPQIPPSEPVGSPRQTRGDWAGFLPTNPESTGAAASPVRKVSLAPDAAVSDQGTFVLQDGPLTTVPDFTGLAVRRVAEECQALGLEPLVHGTGLAAEQNPPAGAKVPSGTKIWIRFAR